MIKKPSSSVYQQLLNLRDQWMISFFDKFENIKEHLLDNSHKDKAGKSLYRVNRKTI